MSGDVNTAISRVGRREPSRRTSVLGVARDGRHRHRRLALPAATVAVKLSRPCQELRPVEPKILAELDVGDRVQARALIEPALGHANERCRLVDGDPSRQGLAHDDDGDGGTVGDFRWRSRSRTTCDTVVASCWTSGIWRTVSTMPAVTSIALVT